MSTKIRLALLGTQAGEEVWQASRGAIKGDATTNLLTALGSLLLRHDGALGYKIVWEHGSLTELGTPSERKDES